MAPETIAGYRIHPAAALFPLMDEAELRTLADDIKKNGQREPILWVLDSSGRKIPQSGHPRPDEDVLILDGRNRLLACEIAGVKPSFDNVQFDDDLIAFVLSKNLHRRHLTAEQRAAIVLQAEELSGSLAKLQADAKVRAPEVRASREARPGKTAKVIADKAKVSRATVERVQAATKGDPAKLDAIAKGTTTSAKVKAAAPKTEPTPAERTKADNAAMERAWEGKFGAKYLYVVRDPDDFEMRDETNPVCHRARIIKATPKTFTVERDELGAFRQPTISVVDVNPDDERATGFDVFTTPEKAWDTWERGARKRLDEAETLVAYLKANLAEMDLLRRDDGTDESRKAAR